MDREDFMKCVNIIAHGIYGGEEQAKYYYNKMIDEPDDEEWSWRFDEAIAEAQSYRDKYGYFKELEDAIEFLRACELIKVHPNYSYEEQEAILKKQLKRAINLISC